MNKEKRSPVYSEIHCSHSRKKEMDLKIQCMSKIFAQIGLNGRERLRKDADGIAYSVDPDQTAQAVMLDLGLHCLIKSACLSEPL